MTRTLSILILSCLAAFAAPMGFMDARVDGTNLINWWTLNEGSGAVAGDYAGTNVANLTNSPTWKTGKIASALQFNGTNQGGLMTNGNAFNFSTNFSVAVWVYPTSPLNHPMGILGNEDNAGGKKGWAARVDGNGSTLKAVFAMNTGGTYDEVDSLVLPSNTWVHLAFIYNAGVAYLYTNGISSTNKAIVLAVNTNNNKVCLGDERVQTQDRHFMGIIDDLRIYNNALNSEQIRLLSNQRGIR
jgi:hypothetical protein